MDECDSLSIDYRDSTNEKGGSGSKVTQTTRPPGAARAAAFLTACVISSDVRERASWLSFMYGTFREEKFI